MVVSVLCFLKFLNKFHSLSVGPIIMARSLLNAQISVSIPRPVKKRLFGIMHEPNFIPFPKRSKYLICPWTALTILSLVLQKITKPELYPNAMRVFAGRHCRLQLSRRSDNATCTAWSIRTYKQTVITPNIEMRKDNTHFRVDDESLRMALPLNSADSLLSFH